MPAQFDQYGLRFAYPDNWQVESATEGGELVITVTSPAPQTAFWSLSVYRDMLDLLELIDGVIEALRTEYPDLEAEAVHDEIAGTILRGSDVSFICLDLTNTTFIRAWHKGASTYLLMAQAEDRELTIAQPVFRAMTTTLLKPKLAEA